MKSLIIVVDFGTSSVKVNLIRPENGEILYTSSKRYPVFSDGAGSAELSAEEIWMNSVLCMKEASEFMEAGSYVPEILTFSWFGDNLLFVDRSEEALSDIVLCMDQRGKEEAEEFQRIRTETEFLKCNGGIPDSSSIVSTLLYFRKKYPEILQKTNALFSNQQYVLSRLGLEPVNDETMACRKALFDLEEGNWDRTLLEELGLAEEMMGRTVSCMEVLGEISSYGDVKLPGSVKVLPGLHDCEAGFVGIGVNRSAPDVLGNVTGTYDHFGYLCGMDELKKGFFQYKGGGFVANRMGFDEAYAVVGAVPAYGLFVDWIITGLFGRNGANMTEYWKNAEFNGKNSIKIIPHIMENNCIISNIGINTGQNEIFEAAIEALTFESKMKFNQCAESFGQDIRRVRIGGGTARAEKWNQLRADVLGVTVECVQNHEVSSLGTALIAAVAAGIYSNTREAASHMIRVTNVYEPDQRLQSQYAEQFQEYTERKEQFTCIRMKH